MEQHQTSTILQSICHSKHVVLGSIWMSSRENMKRCAPMCNLVLISEAKTSNAENQFLFSLSGNKEQVVWDLMQISC